VSILYTNSGQYLVLTRPEVWRSNMKNNIFVVYTETGKYHTMKT